MSYFNRSAFIISNPASIQEILGDKPPIFHIYLVGTFVIKHPNVTVYNKIDHDLAVTIVRDLLKRHLIHIFCDAYTKDLKEKVTELFVNMRGFALGGGVLRALENLWGNLPFLANSFSIDLTKNLFFKKPLIIVSSGPSLAKNIDLLRELQDKAIIITVGSAIIPLLKRGIKPHFEVVVDPYPEMYEILQSHTNPETVFLLSIMAQYRIAQDCEGHRMFSLVSYDSKVLEDLKRYTQINTVLTAAASVATVAFSFALHVGADPIIFVGQDMCFSDDKSYIDDMVTIKDRCQMTTLDGRIVNSLMSFKAIFDYFSAVVPQIKDRTIINATEGGAGIRGAQQLTLAETAARYLNNQFILPELSIHRTDIQALKNRLLEIRRNFSAIYVKASGFNQKRKNSVSEEKNSREIAAKITHWFQTIRIMPGYEYLAEFLDWLWFQVDTSDKFSDFESLVDITEQTFKSQIEFIEKALPRIS